MLCLFAKTTNDRSTVDETASTARGADAALGAPRCIWEL